MPFGEDTLAKLPNQHDEIEIDYEDPFANDRLDRKPPIQTLTNLLGNIDSPCILSIDAPWGTGKTTFLRMWNIHLKKMGFVVVHFNAWQNDFSNYPFLALTSEITTQLETNYDNDIGQFDADVRALKRLAGIFAVENGPSLVGALALAGGAATGISLLGVIASMSVAWAAKRLLASHKKSQNSVDEFREKLKELAKKLAEGRQGRPIVIQIDELDRCRPTYAIELLENVKHIFNVRNVIFVLSTNRDQLSHSVKAIYGDGFAANEYLERFFDISFNLPHLDRENFIHNSLESTRVGRLFKETFAKRTFVAFLNDSKLNLREIDKTIHHLNLVSASLDTESPLQVEVAAILMMLRSVSYPMYQQLVQDGLTPEQISRNIYTGMRKENLRNAVEQAVYEAIVQAANLRLRGNRRGSRAVLQEALQDKPTFNDYGLDDVLLEYITAVSGVGYLGVPIDIDGLILRIELLTEGHPQELDSNQGKR